MKKLLHIHTASVQPATSGGLNTTLLQVFSMCSAFARAGFDVTLAMQRNAGFDENLDAFISNTFPEGIDFEIVTWKQKSTRNFINRVRVKSDIVEIVGRLHPDLIFSRDSFALNALTGLGIPLIFESHNSRMHTGHTFLHHILEKRLLRVSRAPSFMCLFSISDALSNYWLGKGVPSQKLFSWHDGFDASLFEQHVDKAFARKTLGLPVDRTIVTYTGGLYSGRGIESIIQLASDFPGVDFLVVGGPRQNQLRYQAMAEDSSVSNISFVGFVEHNSIPSYLYASDILLGLWSSKVPTINYCSPLKVFEYMATGRMIVAHGFPTIKEVLEDGKEAILCEPDDYSSLKDALARALDQYATSDMGTRARKKAFEMYSWDTRVSRLLDFVRIHPFDQG